MDRLPAELHIAICRDLSSDDMASLALCSHSHNALVRPLLYEHIRVWDRGTIPRYKDRCLGWKYEHSRLFALVTTIVSRPSFFGPFVKSIKVVHTEFLSESDLGQIALCFQAMTNLRSLWVISYISGPAFTSFISHVCSGAVSPSLVEFQCSPTPTAPFLFEFVRSHPNLSVLRLSVDDQNGQNKSQPRFESISPQARLPHLTTLELTVGSGGLAFATELLRVSALVERLSITYSRSLPKLLTDLVLIHLESFDGCSRLNHLIIEGTPHHCSQSFSWIISSILPKIPNLRILELRQARYKNHTTSSGNPQQVIRIDSLLPGQSDVISAFPTKLETLRWLGADAFFPTVRSDLSPHGTSNVNALLELFPSLKVVKYRERGYMFIFRRSEGGVVVRQAVRSTVPLDMDRFPWS
ncbi:uncharacterized protein STEHIDRAFT_167153 [Stereum hirsutum FP-91666 SS1]|uniref:uncharacterized protein n=1 Tax=Stereum hirsutum (strain FP-91666) TaxID=721885 RepID=UPI000440BE4C|nr:uncharacterized protein STEHIDRAFT_167153 [Stereum hirsutum FP-91666 SS1]EIM89316.1 hypothetical protein STEHIDRAFT_167153 [Stereum hirsutum FP-91666 SS1]